MTANLRSSIARPWFTAALLAAILIFGFLLRTQNLNWDQSQHLHPDERFLSIITSQISLPDGFAEYLDSAVSPLNPYNQTKSFVYGTVPLFTNKLVSTWLAGGPDQPPGPGADFAVGVLNSLPGVDLQRDDGGLRFDNRYNSNLIGRLLSTLTDSVIILTVFELGRYLFGRRVGLLAALLMAVTVLHIQYAHFFGSEPYLALFVTATVYGSARIWREGRWWDFLFTGVMLGMGLASKLSGLPVVVVPALATLMRIWPQLEAAYEDRFRRALPWPTSGGFPRRPRWSRIAGPIAGMISLCVVGLLVFRLFQPYAFAGPELFNVFNISLDDQAGLSQLISPATYLDLDPRFVADIEGLLNLQSGVVDFPPSLQWIDRFSFGFALRNMALWGLGPPLALAVISGLVYSSWRIVRRRDFTTLLLVVWVLFLFWFLGRSFVPSIRYFQPIYPAMIVLAAVGLVKLWSVGGATQRLAAFRDRFSATIRMSGRGRSILPGGAAIGWLIRAGVVLLIVASVGWALAFGGVYRQDHSRIAASEWIAANMPPGSVVTSNLWDDGLPLLLPGLPTDFGSVQLEPFVADSEQKVRTLVAGLNQADYVIESSNRVYDTVSRIPARFPNTNLYYRYLFDGSLGFEQVAEFTNYPELFGIEIPDQSSEEAFTVYDHPKVTIWRKTSLFSPERALALLKIQTASTAVNVTPIDSDQNALRLSPADQRLQTAGGTWSEIFDPGGFTNQLSLPIWFLLIQLPGLALLPVTTLLFRGLADRGYLLTKVIGLVAFSYLVWGPVSFGLFTFTRGSIALVLAGMLVFGLLTGWVRRRQLAQLARQHWRGILLAETVFLLAFLAAFAVRLANPDLWHPFRGGEKPMEFAYLNAIIRSTTLPPFDPWFAGGYINYYYYGHFIVANLTKLTGIMPEVAFNLAVPTFFSLSVAAVGSLTYNVAEAARGRLGWRPGFRRIAHWPSLATAGLAIFLTLLAGNVVSALQAFSRVAGASAWDITTPVIGPLVNLAGGAVTIVIGQAPFDYDFWAPSRAINRNAFEVGQVGPITEFPFFTFLFADLHPHMIVIPISLTLLAVGFAALHQAAAWRRLSTGRRIAYESASIVLMGLLLGTARWTNAWDQATFTFLAIAMLGIAEWSAARKISAGVIGRWILKVLSLFVVSSILFWPAADNYLSPVDGVHLAQQTTSVRDFLGHFGAFVIFAFVVLGAWLLRSARRIIELRRFNAFAAGALGIGFLVVGGGIVAFGSAQGNLGVIALGAIALVAIAALALRELVRPGPNAPVRLFLLTILAMAFGLTAGVDLVTVNGDLTRMNTVFKFYLHAWLLYSIFGAVALWELFVSIQPAFAGRRVTAVAARSMRRGFAAIIVGGLVGLSLYPILALPERVADRFNPLPPTADGLAYAQSAVYRDILGDIALAEDIEAIRWLRENVQGSPAIIEGVTPGYRWGGRISINTGLPAVIGWDWHQRQQRGRFGAAVAVRTKDVTTFFNSSDAEEQVGILERYEVRYVVVGRLERNYFPGQGLANIDAGLDGRLVPVFRGVGTTVYEHIPRI